MYKIASDSAQARASRIDIRDLVQPVIAEDGSEEMRKNLVKQMQLLQSTLAGVTDKEQRKRIGMEIAKINERINAIRPKRKKRGPEHFFIDAAREILTSAMFHIVMDRAVALYDQRQGEEQ